MSADINCDKCGHTYNPAQGDCPWCEIKMLREELEQVTNQRDTLRKLLEAKDTEHLLYADKLEKHIMKQAVEISDLHVEVGELKKRSWFAN